MDTTRDLRKILSSSVCVRNAEKKTYDITFVHFASETSAPLCQYDAGRHCNQIIRSAI